MNYEERKIIFIARATRHFDTPEIREEAARMFDEANKERKPKMEVVRLWHLNALAVGVFIIFLVININDHNWWLVAFDIFVIVMNGYSVYRALSKGY